MAELMDATPIIRSKSEQQIPRRLLDITEAGRYIGVGHKVVRELIQTGELPYLQRIPGRSPYLLDIRDLDQWIDRNKTRAPTA